MHHRHARMIKSQKRKTSKFWRATSACFHPQSSLAGICFTVPFPPSPTNLFLFITRTRHQDPARPCRVFQPTSYHNQAFQEKLVVAIKRTKNHAIKLRVSSGTSAHKVMEKSSCPAQEKPALKSIGNEKINRQ
jgi:hypothetical protein